jgi:haloalkane dehalogenase
VGDRAATNRAVARSPVRPEAVERKERIVNDDHRHAKRFAEVLGRRMAYVEAGSGDPVVFLHGNPTSSYLWRNVIPHVAPFGRCIAPDLIGMGDSDKLDDSGSGSYRFVEHRAYLDALLVSLGADERVVFVVHDWGSALGFDWASRHPAAVRGLAYMEAIVCPLHWEDWPPAAREVFEGLRSPAGEEMVLQKNVFVERILPGSVQRDLGEDEMAEYRRPFAEPGESRRPTLTWPREIPIDGHPADVSAIVASYAQWLAGSAVPKLFVNAEPGAILTGRQRALCRAWPNQHEVTVAGIHFLQEDSPAEIGRAIADWLAGLP